MQVQTGGVISECGCAAYMMACPKEAVVVWTLTKVIRLEGTVLAWEEFQRSSYCFTQNGGVPGESADVQPAWWLDLKATSDERMCCADGYESILGFSFPCCHQTLLHLAKITMSSWHSVLPIHMSSHNISRITHLFSPKILHLNQRHLFRCVTHWYCHN